MILTCVILGALVCVLAAGFGWAAFYLYRTNQHKNNIANLLFTAPDGYYYENMETGGHFCSRRLCVLLNLVAAAKFDQVLQALAPDSAARLKRQVQELAETRHPFECIAQDGTKSFYFSVSGSILIHQPTQTPYLIIWFKNTTAWTAELTLQKERLARQENMNDLLAGAWRALPMPIEIVHNQKSVFSNQPAESDADLAWSEAPFTTSAHAAVLRYAQDKSAEEHLRILLNQARTVHTHLIASLPCAAALFDASTQVIEASEAFLTMWQLPPAWRAEEPNFADFWDAVQEAGLLPRVADFAQFKQQQYTAFTQLARAGESFIYLADGRVIKRVMMPDMQGGVLILDEFVANQ